MFTGSTLSFYIERSRASICPINMPAIEHFYINCYSSSGNEILSNWRKQNSCIRMISLAKILERHMAMTMRRYHLFNCTHITHHIVAPGFVDRPRRSDCTAGQMDGEAGWWTTSGNIGLPPLARAMGVGRQQQIS